MRPRSYRQNKKNVFCELTEKGSVIIMSTFIIVAILALAGLAIDAGNLFRAQIVMQNAADAASLATVNYVSLNGRLNLERRWGITGANPSETPPVFEVRQALLNEKLRPKAEKLVMANMMMGGFPNRQSRPITLVAPTGLELKQDISTNGPAYHYTAAVTRSIDYLLMHLTPFGGSESFRTISAVATAQRSSLNISLVLDVSDSMNCPRDSTQPCTCLIPGADEVSTTCPGPGDRRIDDLYNATAEFLKLFELHRDDIHLVPFNISAKGQSIQSHPGLIGLGEQYGLDLASITAAQVDAFVAQLKQDAHPTSATNLCDGLTQAWAMRNELNPDQPSSYIVFTDGAPTAGRFLFSDSAANSGLATWDSGYLPQISTATPHFDNGLGNYDYMSYTVQWLAQDSTFRAGPSLLVESGHLEANQLSGRYNPIASSPHSPQRPTPSGCEDGLTEAPLVSGNQGVDIAASKTFACVDSMESHLPREPSRTYGANYNAVDGTLHKWREQYYNCAIELSDLVRRSKGTIHMFGLGASSSTLASNPIQDPYQNINDNWGRKDVFLTRVALDFKRHNSSYKEFSYDGYRNYETLRSSEESVRAGTYYPTHNSADMKLLFTKLGRELLLKLVR